MVEIAGASPWKLEYLELATHYGETRGYDLVVIPALSHHYGQPSVPWTAFALVAILGVFLLPEYPLSRTAWRLHRIMATAVAALLFVVFLSPYASPYGLLLSIAVFVEAIVALAAPRLWRAGDWMWRRQHQPPGAVPSGL